MNPSCVFFAFSRRTLRVFNSATAVSCIRHRASLFSASGYLLAAVGLFAPAFCRADISVTVDQGQDSSQHMVEGGGANNGGGSDNGSANSNKKSGKSGSITTGDSSSTFFTITLRNTLDIPVSGVELEYHIYNKTTNLSSSGTPTISVDDISDKVTVNIDGSGVKKVETKDIPHVVTITETASKAGKNGKAGTPSSTSSSVQDVMGWAIFLNFRGRRVRTFTSSGDILDQVAKYTNPNGNS
jgi:hypothetical protein